MDYLLEAQKFVQRARDAANREVVSQHLEMAAWCLKQALEERLCASSSISQENAAPGRTTGQIR